MTTELSPRARALLDSARQAPCEADARTVERMEKAVLVATGATVVTTAAGATAAKTAAGLTLTTKLFIVGTAVVVVAGAAVTLDLPPQKPMERVPLTSTRKPVVEPPPSPAVAPPEVKTEWVESAPPAEPRPATPVVTRPKVVVASPPVEPPPVAPMTSPAPSAPDLARELELLSVAKTALGENRFRAVLAQVEKHDTEFPNGTLSVEAEVLRVLALCELERESEALDRASKLRATAKASPALKRLGGSCVDP